LRASQIVELFGSSMIVGVLKVSYKKYAGHTAQHKNIPIKAIGSISKKLAISTTRGAKNAP
jgi:hypothetical protein